MADLRKHKVRKCLENGESHILREFHTRKGAADYIGHNFPEYTRIDDDTWSCPNTLTDIYISRV